MSIAEHITQELLIETLDYNPLTGIFVWRKGRLGVAANTIAGTGYSNRHVNIIIDCKSYRAHRLAILYCTGEIPPDDMDVDHIDGNPRNNAIANLRVVTHKVNLQNRVRANRRSTGRSSKLLGVSWKKDKNKWVANIKHPDGKQMHLGYFTEEHEAHRAYLTAKRELHEGNTL